MFHPDSNLLLCQIRSLSLSCLVFKQLHSWQSVCCKSLWCLFVYACLVFLFQSANLEDKQKVSTHRQTKSPLPGQVSWAKKKAKHEAKISEVQTYKYCLSSSPPPPLLAGHTRKNFCLFCAFNPFHPDCKTMFCSSCTNFQVYFSVFRTYAYDCYVNSHLVLHKEQSKQHFKV